MTDMRRTLLWVMFSMSIFLIWDAWKQHNGEASFFSPTSAVRPTPAAAPPAVPAVVPGLPTPTTAAAPATAAASPAPLPAASAPQTAPLAEQVTVTTDLVKATLDSKGGDLIRLELLKQVDKLDATKNTVLLDQSAERFYVAQSGLVPASGGAGLPNHHTVMTLVPGERTLQPGQNSLQVRFESPVVGGVKLIKTYTFKRNDYLVDVTNEVVNESSVPVDPRLYLQLVRDGNAPAGESSFYFTFTGPAIYDDSAHYKKIDFKSIEKRKPGEKPDHEIVADNGWVAMVQHYFVSAWLIDQAGAKAAAKTGANTGANTGDSAGGPKQQREFFTGKVAPNTYSVGMIVALGTIAPGASKALDANLFIGPQEEDELATLAPGLELVKDYGYFKVLAEPLFWLLTQLHKFLGNWGWSIVGLVLLLRAAFFWLNLKAYTSMAKMKAVTPRITEMRERLKDKPQQMQQEMMRIYREEKINPLGGCLPMLVQMPFFIALYWVLLSSVEMRHAPWIGWITDLSAKDPYFILPLLMTATGLVQTWLNPTPADPIQAKMMWIMPLAFSVMFFVFPAGLVLYWVTNNILTIAQQYVINKRLGVLST